MGVRPFMRPWYGRLLFLLTGGQAADCRAGERLLAEAPGALVQADKGYDTTRLRHLIEAGDGTHEHPAESQPRLEELLLAFPLPRPKTQRGNAIERMFGRLKDFRRIATTVSPKTTSPPLCLAALVSCWI